MNRLFNVVIAVSCAIIAVVVADEVRAYRSLSRQFPEMEMSTITPRCSPEHFYGRRVRISQEGTSDNFYACYDWQNDKWKLTPIGVR